MPNNFGGRRRKAPSAKPKPYKPLKLSPQQSDIMDWVSDTDSGSLIIEARAGCGKTSTLMEMLPRIVDHNRRATVCLLAYNRAIAEELKLRVAGMPAAVRYNATVGTCHSVGWGLLRPLLHSKGGKKNGGKVSMMIAQYSRRDVTTAYIRKDFGSLIKKMVDLAKQHVAPADVTPDWDLWPHIVEHFNLEQYVTLEAKLGFDDPIGHAIELACELYRMSLDEVSNNSFLDFEDMILCPLLSGAVKPTYDYVLLDEAQDSNPARRQLALGLLSDNGDGDHGRTGRLIAVGDDKQAIYGFTGASSDALDQIRQATDAITMPLTVTYRCPKRVVAEAQQYVPDIEAHDTAPTGSVGRGSVDSIIRLGETGELNSGSKVILCRCLAPLLRLAYAFLKRGIKCHIEGKDYMSFIRRTAESCWDDDPTVFLGNLQEYTKAEVDKLAEKQQNSKAATLEDTSELLQFVTGALLDQQVSVKKTIEVLDFVQDLFTSSEGVTMCSIHKAKGREWDAVFILYPELIPIKWAKMDWEKAQESNLACRHHAVQGHLGVHRNGGG